MRLAMCGACGYVDYAKRYPSDWGLAGGLSLLPYLMIFLE